MIFYSIPTNNLRFETIFTSFDHLFGNATFEQVRPRVEPTMKDQILGSDEYLIRAQDTILQHLERFDNGPLQPIDDNQTDNDQEESYKHADENLAVHDIHNGRTTLHVFNSIIKELQGIHNEISKEKTNKQRSEVRRISHQLFQLKQTRKRVREEEEKQGIDEQITDIQRRISNNIEAKDKAAQMRISNFCKTRIGKMVPESFHCTKEKRVPRKIHTLHYEGRIKSTRRDCGGDATMV